MTVFNQKEYSLARPWTKRTKYKPDRTIKTSADCTDVKSRLFVEFSYLLSEKK